MTDVIITDKEQRLLTTDGFIKEYYRQCSFKPTYRAAYEACEEVYIRIVGKRKYKDYGTFKTILWRRNRKMSTMLTKSHKKR